MTLAICRTNPTTDCAEPIAGVEIIEDLGANATVKVIIGYHVHWLAGRIMTVSKEVLVEDVLFPSFIGQTFDGGAYTESSFEGTVDGSSYVNPLPTRLVNGGSFNV